MPTVIHIVDDDAQVRAATSFLLAGQGYATQVYADGEEFLTQARLGTGCILLDLRLGGASGLDLLEEFPSRGVTLPVIMISGHGDLRLAVQAMKLGAVDFLQKPYQEAELVAAIERALDAAKKRQDRNESKAAAVARIERLSPRERQILQGLLAGMANKAIARKLDLSPRTVEMHRANMMSDLGISSLPEAIRFAIDAELPALDGDDATAIPLTLLAPTKTRSLRDLGDPSDALPLPAEVLEGTTDCAVLLDTDWRFTYVNANAAEAFGAGRDLIGRVVWDTFPLGTASKAWDLLHRASTDRQPVRFDFFSPDLGRWLDVNVRPVSVGLQIFFRDITDERKASASLKMSEETLRLLLETLGDGAWDWNIAAGEIEWSGHFLQRLGYPEDHRIDTFDSFREMIHPSDWPDVAARLSDHLDGLSEIFTCQYRLRRRDDSWMWTFDRGRIVDRDAASGMPTRMVGATSDITDRKEADFELERVRSELARLSGLAEMGVMAGELIRPLSDISNHLQYLRQALTAPAEKGGKSVEEALNAAEASAAQAGEIVGRMNEHAAVPAIDPKRVSLPEVVGEAVQIAHPSETPGPQPTVEIDPSAALVLADRVRLEQVLVNLIRNARAAMEQVGADEPVRIAAGGQDGEAVVRVSDSGPSIGARSAGRGAGVAISQTIVEAHGGRFWVENNVPSGSVFCFTLSLPGGGSRALP